MRLKLSEIKTDGGTQSRVALDQSVVAEYAEHMKEGDEFPPITVFHDGSAYWLADGFHRFFATKANKVTDIEAEVKQGTQNDCILFSFASNSRRGLRMTSADRRNIVTRMLDHPEWKHWSQREIAKHVGCTAMTVGRIKKSLEVPKVEKAVKPKVNTVPEESFEEDMVTELSDTVTSLAEENALLKDKIALGQWDASEIEKIDVEELIADLRKQVKALEIENKSLRESRDMFQSRNNELMQTVKSLQAKIKKGEK